MKNRLFLAIVIFAVLFSSPIQPRQHLESQDKFRQLNELLPTPNNYRTASGAPGHQYWQQKADYKINVSLDEKHQCIHGSEEITYTNNSPDTLHYLWIQLDQNRYEKNSFDLVTQPPLDFADRPLFFDVNTELYRRSFEGGFYIISVTDHKGQPLKHTIVKTMMRIDLTTPLPPKSNTVLNIAWKYNVIDASKVWVRSGFEYFEGEDNYLFAIAQFYPRMAAYTDRHGWQNKQFLGRGEFTLEFGDFEVSIQVPADHIVAATGELQNPDEILSKKQKERLKKARTAKKPVFIVTPKEAQKTSKKKALGKGISSTRTWVFHAKNVRDFAFASSRKFIWDAMGTPGDGHTVLAMSFYPEEGRPLWEKFATHAVAHTIEQYSKYTFPYPYPTAISVNGPPRIDGMEYPMICFLMPRPEKDKTYSLKQKWDTIGINIHEVGHNFFPMIVNSDERNWSWMDEGLNTFLQYLATQHWEKEYSIEVGESLDAIDYMKSEDQRPIMTNPSSIPLLQHYDNAYIKAAAALNVLRETVLGRELFDFSFKEYARRWKFKRPTPADFFRTMEDASGADLDWFWRGWFYTTDHTDIAIKSLKRFDIDTLNPDKEFPITRKKHQTETMTLSKKRSVGNHLRTDDHPELKDIYSKKDQFTVTDIDRKYYQIQMDSLSKSERALLNSKNHFFILEFENPGGLVMPIILDILYVDGTHEELRIPAEIWRYNHNEVGKLIIREKKIKAIALDPHLETGDVNRKNNYWPRREEVIRFKMDTEPKEPNLMQKLKK
jgi:Peptidase family M1 domain